MTTKPPPKFILWVRRLCLGLLLIFLLVKMTAPIAIFIGPPSEKSLVPFKGKVFIPPIVGRPSLTGDSIEMKSETGELLTVHCGFVMAKQSCFFMQWVDHFNQEVMISVHYHWYWGVMNHESRSITKPGSIGDLNYSREKTFKFHFRPEKRYVGLEKAFVYFGLLVAVLLGLWSGILSKKHFRI